MDYVVIDFETANSKRNSACALGLIEVSNEKIINEKNYLFNPEDIFDSFNTHLHKISSDMVKDKPTFPELWSEIKFILENKLIVAHNAQFDIGVLKSVLEKYNLKYPNFKYVCTRILSRKTWPNLVNYKLTTVANNLNLNFVHHQAYDDAKVTSEIFNEIIKINNVSNLDELSNKLNISVGILSPEEFKPTISISTNKKAHISSKDFIPETNIFDENHAFFGKGIAFTGTLSIDRKSAAQLAVNKGAFYCNSVTKKTNFLVLGVQDYARFVDGEKSSKLKKAEELIASGQELEIIGEDEFFYLL